MNTKLTLIECYFYFSLKLLWFNGPLWKEANCAAGSSNKKHQKLWCSSVPAFFRSNHFGRVGNETIIHLQNNAAKMFQKMHLKTQCNSGWLVTVYVILISQIPSKTGPHHKNTFLICYPYSVIYIVWFTSKCLRVGSFNESFIALSRSNTKIWLFLLLTEHDECFPWFVLVPAQKIMYWFICNPPKKNNNNIKHLN